MKRFLGAVLAVVAVIVAIDMILRNVILVDAYKQALLFFGSEAGAKSIFGLIWAGYLLFALFFVWIFAKGYEKGKSGIGEGMHFGALEKFLVFAAIAIMCFAIIPLPVVVPVVWVLGVAVEFIVAGIIVGLVYKKF